MTSRIATHVGDRLDPAVGVPREAGQVILRNVIAEVIEKEKWVEIGGVAEAERAAQVDTRPFEGWLGLDEPLHWSNGHINQIILFTKAMI